MGNDMNKVRDALESCETWSENGLTLFHFDKHKVDAALAALDAEPVASSAQPAQAWQSDRDTNEILEALRNSDVDPLLSFSAKEMRTVMNLWATEKHLRETLQSRAAQPAQAQAVPEDALADLQDTVSKAMRRAWQLGQTYWQQANSDFTSQHKKADETQRKFDTLVDETRAAVLSAAPALPQQGKKGDADETAATVKEAFRELSHIEFHLESTDAPLSVKNRTIDLRGLIHDLNRALARKSAAPPSNQPEQDQLFQLSDEEWPPLPEKIVVGVHALSEEYAEGWNDCIDEYAHSLLSSRKDAEDARRYRCVRSLVGGMLSGGWRQVFHLEHLKPVEGANLMKGSVAQHFNEAVDSALAAQQEGKDGGA